MPRLSRLLAPFFVLLLLGAAPLAARAANFQEFVSIDVLPGSLVNNYVVFPGGSPGVDAGQVASVQIFISVTGGGVPDGTLVQLNLTGTVLGSGGAPTIGLANTIQILTGPGVIIPINVHAESAKAGSYQIQLTATDPASGVSSNTPLRGLLVTTPAADFKSMTASTRMTVALAGPQVPQILVKAMATANPDVSSSAPAHFRMIFHNVGTSTVQITSGASSFFLAPKDVLPADLSTQFDVVANVYDGASGLLEIGYP